MSLNKGYSVHAEIKHTLAEIHDNESAFKITKWSQNFLTIATTLIYYSFTSVIFAGVSVWAFQDYVFGNATNVNGLVFTVALVVSTPIGLALAKHSNFQAMARAPDIKVFIIRALIALAILTGIWYEAVSSSANLQEKAFHAVENSKAGESIMNTNVTVGSNNGEALAKAEYKLVSCQRKLKEGTVKDCDNSQAFVNSLKNQASLDRAATSEANDKAIVTKQATMDKERDSHALPPAKAFASWFDTTIAVGTFIIVIISSLFFELIHLSTVYSERNNLLKQKDLNRHLQTLKNEYFMLVGKTYSPDDFKDDVVLDMQELRASGSIPDFKEAGFNNATFEDGNNSLDDLDQSYKITTKGKPYEDSKIGFGSPQTASKFKWQQVEKPLPAPQEKVFGFMSSGQRAGNTNLAHAHAVTPETRPYTVGGNPAERNPLKSVNTVTPHDYKRPTLAEIDKALSEQPLTGDVVCPVCGVHVERRNIPNKRFCCKEHQKYHWKLKQKITNA